MLKRICDICNREIEGYNYYQYSLSTHSDEATEEHYYEHVCKGCAQSINRAIRRRKEEIAIIDKKLSTITPQSGL